MGQTEESKKMKELRSRTGMTRKAFAEFFHVPYDTYQKWELGSRTYTPYIYDLMEYKIKKEGMINIGTGQKGKETDMQLVKYLEHNGERFIVGDHVIISAYGKPKFKGTIDFISECLDDCPPPKIHIIPEDGGRVMIELKDINTITKLPRINKTNSISREKYDKLGRVWELNRANNEDSWDVCLDGVWYGLNLNMDTSDRLDLLTTIEEKNLELQNIPFWNCCDSVKNSGLKKMVRTDADTVYLLEYGDK